MKTVTSLTAALIASVALVGFSAPASASRTVDPGKTEKFACNVFKVEGPDKTWFRVGQNVPVSRTKTSLMLGNARFTFEEDQVENKRNGSWDTTAFYSTRGGLEFMMIEEYDTAKPAGKKLSYTFLLNDGDFSKSTTTKVYGTCQMTYN